MRAKKLLKGLAIILLIICIIILGIDIFKNLQINFNFMKMQASDRISSSSKAPEVKYAPTDYSIANKEDVLTEIKKITLELKEDHLSKSTEHFFEIANIHKIKNLFYDYQSYAVVKYKLLNIVENLSDLYKTTNGYNDSEFKNYFEKNTMYIENYYGISRYDEFLDFVKSLGFLRNTEISSVSLNVATINFDYDNDNLKFEIIVETKNGELAEYFIDVDYYKSSTNQIKPYLKISN